MKRQERVRAGDLVPDVGRENVKEPGGRQNGRGQFLLRFDVTLGEIRIARHSVIDQIGDVAAIESFIVTEAGKAGGGIDPQENAEKSNEEKSKKDRSRQPLRARGVLVSRHFSSSCSCNALNSDWLG